MKTYYVEKAVAAAMRMDWMQVVLNESAPCFHIEKDGKFCGRAERWPGHLDGDPHEFVSLADLISRLK